MHFETFTKQLDVCSEFHYAWSTNSEECWTESRYCRVNSDGISHFYFSLRFDYIRRTDTRHVTLELVMNDESMYKWPDGETEVTLPISKDIFSHVLEARNHILDNIHRATTAHYMLYEKEVMMFVPVVLANLVVQYMEPIEY